MVQGIMLSSLKPDDLSFIPGIYIGERKNWLLQFITWPLYTHTLTHIQNHTFLCLHTIIHMFRCAYTHAHNLSING